jgi:hypothetical protein
VAVKSSAPWSDMFLLINRTHRKGRETKTKEWGPEKKLLNVFKNKLYRFPLFGKWTTKQIYATEGFLWAYETQIWWFEKLGGGRTFCLANRAHDLGWFFIEKTQQRGPVPTSRNPGMSIKAETSSSYTLFWFYINSQRADSLQHRAICFCSRLPPKHNRAVSYCVIWFQLLWISLLRPMVRRENATKALKLIIIWVGRKNPFLY